MGYDLSKVMFIATPTQCFDSTCIERPNGDYKNAVAITIEEK
jgi:hypothetical protein